MLTAESEANLRRARIEAKWELRQYRREFGDYRTRNVIDDIRMAAWLTERIRAEAGSQPPLHLAVMRAQLLRKLATAELIVTWILASSSSTGAGSS